MKILTLRRYLVYGLVLPGLLTPSLYGSTEFNDLSQPVPSKNRRQILEALSSLDRDKILSTLVPSRLVNGETWFDLREIEVTNGELQGDNLNLSHICWDHAHLKNLDLSTADLNGVLLRNATVDHVRLRGAVLDNVQIEGTVFQSCDLSECSLRGATANARTKFIDCIAQGARFDTSQHLKAVEFSGGSLRSATFRHARMESARFIDIDLSDSDMTGTDLTDAQFYGAVLAGVDLTDSVLVRSKFDAVRLSGNLRLVRTTLQQTVFGDLDLSKVDLTYVIWRDGDYHLGEELIADKILASDSNQSAKLEAAEQYEKAENIYRTLAQRYKGSGYLREYLALHVRSQDARRKFLSVDGRGADQWEGTLLEIYRVVDNYDTSPRRFFAWLLAIVLLFAAIFFLLFTFGSQWFVWFRIRPNDRVITVDDRGNYVESASDFESGSPSARVWRTLLCSLELSIEALFRFVENIIDIPNIAALFMRRSNTRPFPKAWAVRAVLGFEAACGVILLYFGSRLIIQMVNIK